MRNETRFVAGGQRAHHWTQSLLRCAALPWLVSGAVLVAPAAAFAGGCVADLNGSGTVDAFDLAHVLRLWGTRGGPGDVDGSGTVDGGDIAVVLAEWGVCGCDGTFRDMNFIDQTVDLSQLGTPYLAVLNGSIAVSATGSANGDVQSDFGPLSATIHVDPATITVDVGAHHIDFLLSGAPSVMIVDGQAQSITSNMELFSSEIHSLQTPDQWSGSTQGYFALESLMNTQQALCFTTAMCAVDGAADSQNTWGCKLTATAAGAAITAIAASGCAFLLAGCGAATYITIGGTAVPCWLLIGLCAGGTYAGAQVTYDAVLAWWKDC